MRRVAGKAIYILDNDANMKLVGSEGRRLGKNKLGIQKREVLRPERVCPGSLFLLATLSPH